MQRLPRQSCLRSLRTFLLSPSPAAYRCRSSPLSHYESFRWDVPGARSLSTSRIVSAALAFQPSTSATPQGGQGGTAPRSSVLVEAPTKAALEEADIDAELVPEAEAKLRMTDSAAQVRWRVLA